VLVTGARGFLGRELVAALQAAGATVVGTTRGRSGSLRSRLADRRIEVLHLDLGSPASVRAALEDARPDFVYHLSGQSRPARAALDPVDTFESNVRVVWVLLDAVRVVNPAMGVVVASTAEHPVDATTRMKPYFASKACAEIVCASYASTYGLKVAIARCGHVYGPDEDESRLVTSIVVARLAGRPVHLQHPRRRFDLLFVEDATAGLAAIADGLRSPGLHEFELSTGTLVSGIDVAGQVDRLVDMGPASVTASAYTSRARRRLKPAPPQWRASTSLASGLSRTIEWHRRRRAAKAHHG
jgi:CDP-glucose 4,6-dehydratase